MASSTPIRRPLANLNSNHALTPQGLRNPSGSFKSTTKSVFVDKALQAIAQEGTRKGEVDNKDGLDGEKRSNIDDEYNLRAHKRQRQMDNPTQVEVSQYGQSLGREGEGRLEKNALSGRDTEIVYEAQEHESIVQNIMSSSQDVPSSPISSEGSSIPSPMPAINESQNTTMTVPDDELEALWPPSSQTNTVPRSLTTEEIRRKAKEIRLRLSLANYKVRTNQIDVPISRLQIRSSTFPSRLLSAPSRPSRTPLPSTSIPNINLQRTSQSRILSVSSSPPPSNLNVRSRLTSPIKSKDSITDGLSTPLLPRQREALLHPPVLGSPEERCLTSSVVKGRAADGLLSLMQG